MGKKHTYCSSETAEDLLKAGFACLETQTIFVGKALPEQDVAQYALNPRRSV